MIAPSHRDRGKSCVPRRRRRYGFSLVELLTVLVIILILTAVSLPLTSSFLSSLSIDWRSSEVVDALRLARQEAISKNCVVEFRFYQSTAGSTQNQFIAYQPVQIGNDGVITSLTKVNYLSAPVVFSSDTNLSSLLVQTQLESWTSTEPQPVLPVLQSNFNSYCFHFRPDGSTDLTSGNKWFITLVDQHRPGSFNQPPQDFATVWVDPISGHSKIVRPD